MALCNEAKLVFDKEKKRVTRHGLPTEAALKVLNEKIGIVKNGGTDKVDRTLHPEAYNEELKKAFTT